MLSGRGRPSYVRGGRAVGEAQRVVWCCDECKIAGFTTVESVGWHAEMARVYADDARRYAAKAGDLARTTSWLAGLAIAAAILAVVSAIVW